MQSGVRAVEAFRRSRLIDGVTSDEDKVAPVFRLEEVCQLIRTSSLGIVREMLDHTLRRLEHKNPIVKQKTLRFMKYAAGKAGPDFKRELQRQAGVVRALFHYKGQLDALKGDALNKAVRETAHEAIAAIFGSDDKPTTMEDVGKRIQGFGSSNYDGRPREEEKKSVISELVGFGSQQLKQSLDMLQNYNHYSNSGSGTSRSSAFTGTYRSQGLRKSLTAERERPDREEGDRWSSRGAEAEDSGPSASVKAASSIPDAGNGREARKDARVNSTTVEDRLLDSLTVPGGIRLQPTRETLQGFANTAEKLDAANLVNSLEIKLKAHSWQVRFKALCLIETSIRQRDDNAVLDSVTAMFEEDATIIVDCLQSPQASLREKAKKVLDLLGSSENDHLPVEGADADRQAGTSKPSSVDLPDLIDTGDVDVNFGRDGAAESSPTAAPKLEPVAAESSAPPVQRDLFGDWIDSPTPARDAEPDPFTGVSFHSSEPTGREPDLFSGLDVNRRVGNGSTGVGSGKDEGSGLFEGLSVAAGDKHSAPQSDFVDLMGSLSTSNSEAPPSVTDPLQSLSSGGAPSHQAAPASALAGSQHLPNAFNPSPLQSVGVFPGPAGGTPHPYFFPQGTAQHVNGFPTGVPGQFPANSMGQLNFGSAPVNFIPGNAPFAQTQFGPGYTSMPRYGGNVQGGGLGGLNQGFGETFDFSSDPSSNYKSVAEVAKKEDTKAFDFISDHLTSQLAPKKSK